MFNPPRCGLTTGGRYGTLQGIVVQGFLIVRRPFSIGRLGRRLGSLLGIAIAAAVVHWFQADPAPEPERPPARQAESSGPSRPPEAGRQSRAQDHGVPAQAPIGAASDAVPAGRYTLQGVVSKVADGDTITLKVNGKSHRVRLDSIDAPETGHGAREPGQPYAEAAHQYLTKLVGGKTLTAQCYEQDQFERDVCALILPDGQSANRVMVASGYAWAYTARRGDYLNDAAMPALQDQARQHGRGLWAQGGPTAPWKWRYECWRNQHCDNP